MSLLLDALQRAAHRREPGSDAHTEDVEETARADRAPAATSTAKAVFRSTEGQRRAFRRRHALIVLGVFALSGAAAAAGWMYWQDLRGEFTRDLARYQIDPEPLPADATAELEASPGVPDGVDGVAEGADEIASEPEPDPAARAVLASWEDTAAAVATANSAQADAEAAAQAEPEVTAASTEPESEAKPEPRAEPAADPATAEAELAAPEPVDPKPADPEPAAEPAPTQAEATATAPRQATPIVQRSRGPSPLEALLHDGYTALQEGDLRTAERAYGEVLERRPDNRDALLGTAAVAQQRGDFATARTHYARVLADEPRDPHAMAGLLSLDGVSEPRRAESELKLLLRDHPDSHALHFALGNLYAAESRWGDAQKSFFEAVRGDNSNPNYVFNLAVALDHLGQRGAARQQYEQALRLAEHRGSAFAPASVRARVEQLR